MSIQRANDGERLTCPRSSSGHHVVAALILLLIGLVGYGQLLIPGRIPFSPHSDIITYHLGTKEVLARSLQAGEGIPFWRADQLAGTPALTNPNTLYTYPFHFLFLLVSPATAMGWTIWFHLVMGAFIYYLVGQVLGLDWWPRLFMGVSALFSFKVIMAVYAGWLSVLPSIVLFPLLILTVFRVVRKPSRTTGLAVTLTGALCLHAGHVQLIYYVGVCLFLWLFSTSVRAWWLGRRRDVLKLVRVLSMSALLACGSAAYLWLPTVAEAPLMSRTVIAESKLMYERALCPRHLLTFLYPQILGTPQTYPERELWEDMAYFGLVPLTLSLVGVVLGRRRSHAGFMVVAFAASMLLALHTPLTPVAYTFFPGFRFFRNPSRLLFLTSFFGIALAGIGLDEVLTRLRTRRGALVAVILTLLVAIEGTFYAWQYVTAVPSSTVLPPHDFLTVVRQDSTVFRVAPVGWKTLNYGIAAPLGLQLITGYEPYNFESYGNYLQLMQLGVVRPSSTIVASWALASVARWDLFDALNVRYVLALHPLTLPAAQFDAVGRDRDGPRGGSGPGWGRGEILIYRNTRALGRAFWSDKVVLAQTEQEAMDLVQQHDVRRVAVVENLKGASPSSLVEAGDRVSTLVARNGSLVLEAETKHGGFLVISEIWHPGWHGWVDDQEIDLYRTNMALLGGWIPPGHHRIRLEFQPVWWHQALGISAVSWAGLLAWMLVAMRSERRSKGGSVTREQRPERPYALQ